MGFMLVGHKSDPQSAERYATFIAAIQRGDMLEKITNRPSTAAPSITVNELVLKFLTLHAVHYRDANGKPSNEVDCFNGVSRHVRSLFGETCAVDFGPLRLRAVRDAMVATGWSRKFINKQINRLRQIFKWGVGHELVPPAVLEALKAVKPL